MTGIAFALLAALILPSCSGSGNNGSSGQITGVALSPLVVADRVSVVDPQGGGGTPVAPTGIKALLIGLISPSQLPTTSDYFADKTTIYVNERSTEAFQGINDILCSVKQTRYDAMINQGPYHALVDYKLCSNDASNSTDQSSDSNVPEYSLWTVRSSRLSETSPHIVDVWLYDPYQDAERPNGQLITAQMIITEGADTAPPYGKFQINYISTDPVTSKEINRGLLISRPNPQTGEALLQFAEETPDFSTIKKATLNKDPDGTGGGTVLEIENIPPEATRFDIAFNTTHFLRQNYDNDINFPPPGSQVCLDRTNFDDSAWRYGLYDQSGRRVNVNSGFSIKRGSEYGWVGYWGFWMPNNPDGTPGTLMDGETVYQHDFSTNTDTPFTVFQSGGKLKRHDKKSLTLGEIKFIPLYWWGSGLNCAVAWDSANFTVIAELDANGNWGPRTSCPVKIDLTALSSTELNFWSESLGGQVRVPLNAIAPCVYSPTTGFTNCSSFDTLTAIEKASTPVIYYAENIVYPGEAVPPTLACYDRCPQTFDASGIDPSVNPLPFYDTWDETNYTSIRFDYTFTSEPTAPAAMLLMEGSNPVILASTSADPNYQWGISTGALIDPNTPNLSNLLDCNWDLDNDPGTPIGLPQICGWKTWSLDQFYTWETGPNSWNKFTGLKDSSGTFVQFDPPLRVTYTHHNPDPVKFTDPLHPHVKYDGVTFNLEYNGFGNLSGIPGACVDMDTGKVSPTGCNSNTRWVPEFTIPDDDGLGNLTEVTGPSPANYQYIVKALEKEQRMQGLTPADCANNGLPETTPYPLPSMTLWEAPTNGPEPNITTDPKVIGGVVQ